MKKYVSCVLILICGCLAMFVPLKIFIAKADVVVRDCGAVCFVGADNDGNFYVLSRNESIYKITSIDKNFNIYEKELDIDEKIVSFAYTDGKFYFFGNGAEYSNERVLQFVNIVEYDCRERVISRKVINYAQVNEIGTSAVDRDGNYYLKYEKAINVYSPSCQFIRSFDYGSYPPNLISNDDGSLIFCAENEGLKVFEGGNSHSFDVYTDIIYMNGGGYFSTGDNIIYKYESGTVTECCGGFEKSWGNAVVKDWFIGLKDGFLTAVQNGEEVRLSEVGGEVWLCGSNGVCGCFIMRDNEIFAEFFHEEDIESHRQLSDSDVSDNPQDTSYIFDSESGIVSGIEPTTTVAAMRKNIESGGETVTFFDSHGNIKTSGTIGTGGKIMIGEAVFDIVIFGELSGEGNVNGNDKKILSAYILGKNDLNGVYLTAADVTGDGEVDLRDYAALDDYMKGKYNIPQTR